ncbi:MAG: hypothetical protein RLZZ142_1352 [Verrucomicrobiota bacterium]|jgi:hypothetical protein
MGEACETGVELDWFTVWSEPWGDGEGVEFGSQDGEKRVFHLQANQTCVLCVGGAK